MAVEKEKDRYYTVWKLIAAHGLFPQNLPAFGLLSKMHREILRDCCATSMFWTKLRRNAMSFAENEFDDQEWINFETLRKSPIAQLPKSSLLSLVPAPPHPIPTTDSLNSRPFRPTRVEKAPGGGMSDGVNGERDPDVSSRGGKRLNHDERPGATEREGLKHLATLGQTVCREELCTRHFLRLCFFPVFWMHEYKRVVLFMNVPQRFQELENELHHRMLHMILKYGRLKLTNCAFHASIHELTWSVEAGRKKRTNCRRYWIPGSPSKEPTNKLPWFKYQTVIAVCECEDDVEMLLARKGRFRKEASIYLTRCTSSGDLDRIMRKGNDLPLTEDALKEEPQ